MELLTTNNVWMMICTALVFFMHLGFSFLEVGLTRQKNTINILFKNFFVITAGLIIYCAVGFNLMYPSEWLIEGILGSPVAGLDAEAAADLSYNEGYTYWTDFLFQGMFAATAATIISGAVAERIKISSFMLIASLYVAIVYPIVGAWKWGGGFMDAAGFYDFAGSTLVHSVGGWAALVGAYILGPRIGKYSKKGIIPIMGHSMPLASIGVFLLWFGWYGFNGGSVLSADPGPVSFVFVTTTLSAAAGVMGAMTLSWSLSKKPDLSMVLNGSLAGLVGITAGADVISPMNALIVGYIAGLLVVSSVLFFDRLRIDDPVGAISVHLTCGIWGTLAVGIFSSDHSLFTQFVGVMSYGLFCAFSSLVIFLSIKKLFGLRVSEEEEISGLDLGEHDMEAYSGFQIFTVE